MGTGVRRFITLGVVVTATTVGCSGGSARQHQPSSANTYTDNSATYAGQSDERTRMATAFAQKLAGEVPRIPGERPLVGSPPSALATPGEVIGVGDLITAKLYWTAPGSPRQVYRRLKRAKAPFPLTGYGRPGAGSQPDGSGFLSYDSPPTPSYIQDSEIHLEIEGDHHGGTVIASFAEVDTVPIRTTAENITAAGSTGTFTWPRIENGKVVGHTTQQLGTAQLQEVVRGFDDSPVSDEPNVCFGALQLAGSALKVEIDSDGHVWKLVYPGTSCGDIAVARDGQAFPAIRPNRQLRHLFQVLAHDNGTVTGRLLEVGGPSAASVSPEPGRVTLTAHGHVVWTARPGQSGRFSVFAQPGRYVLAGTTPHYRIDGKPGRCVAAHDVTITTGKTVHADVYCQRR